MIKKRSLGTEEYNVCDSCGEEVQLQYGKPTQGWGSGEHLLCQFCLDDVCFKALKLQPRTQDSCGVCGKKLPRTYDGNTCEKCASEVTTKNTTDYQMVQIYDKM